MVPRVGTTYCHVVTSAMKSTADSRFSRFCGSFGLVKRRLADKKATNTNMEVDADNEDDDVVMQKVTGKGVTDQLRKRGPRQTMTLMLRSWRS